MAWEKFFWEAPGPASAVTGLGRVKPCSEKQKNPAWPQGPCWSLGLGGGAKRTLRLRGADELSSLREANSAEFRIREIRSDRTFQVLSFLIKNGRPARWTDLPFLVQVTGLEPA